MQLLIENEVQTILNSLNNSNPIPDKMFAELLATGKEENLIRNILYFKLKESENIEIAKYTIYREYPLTVKDTTDNSQAGRADLAFLLDGELKYIIELKLMYTSECYYENGYTHLYGKIPKKDINENEVENNWATYEISGLLKDFKKREHLEGVQTIGLALFQEVFFTTTRENLPKTISETQATFKQLKYPGLVQKNTKYQNAISKDFSDFYSEITKNVFHEYDSLNGQQYSQIFSGSFEAIPVVRNHEVHNQEVNVKLHYDILYKKTC